MRRGYVVALAIASVVFLLSRTARGQAVIASGVDTVVNAVRGIRNNNPGNLRANQFRGVTGVDAQGYATYDTMANGIRASARQLALYFSRGIDSVQKVIATWAPTNENDTTAYIAAVSRYLGVRSESPLTLNEETHAALLRAIFRHELGSLPAAMITDAAIIRAIREA